MCAYRSSSAGWPVCASCSGSPPPSSAPSLTSLSGSHGLFGSRPLTHTHSKSQNRIFHPNKTLKAASGNKIHFVESLEFFLTSKRTNERKRRKDGATPPSPRVSARKEAGERQRHWREEERERETETETLEGGERDWGERGGHWRREVRGREETGKLAHPLE